MEEAVEVKYVVLSGIKETSESPQFAALWGHAKDVRLPNALPAIRFEAGEGAVVAVVAIGGQDPKREFIT
jgi:hypothetical protein